jgi:uncharacterized protein (DUF2132 family)
MEKQKIQRPLHGVTLKTIVEQLEHTLVLIP